MRPPHAVLEGGRRTATLRALTACRVVPVARRYADQGVGFGLATLFKQSAMAIGLGLAYVLVIENLVFSLLDNLGDPWNQIQQWFPISNAGYLQDSFGKVNSAVTVTIKGGAPATATHAVIVLGLWVIGIAVVSAGLVRVRDVT